MGSGLVSVSSENWPFSLEWLPQPIYLVGGAVRDALLKRRSDYLDLDFVLPSEAVRTAREIASRCQAGFVLLDAERQIARVVFPQATVDFAQQEGFSLETDLRRRDFTVNAIAYNPHTGELIDPLQGHIDLQMRLLRMVQAANLQADPLRLLRAYRQAAQLGFVIEPETQTIIRSLASQLRQVAAERVRVELGYLLSSAKGTPWISAAGKDGLLAPWFNTTQFSFAQVAAIDASAVVLAEIWPILGVKLSQFLRDTVKTSWLTIAKLTKLVSPEPEVAEAELMRLTYSRAEIKSVTTALKLLPQLQPSQPSQMSLRSQYFLFRAAGDIFPTLVLLAIATGTAVEEVTPLVNRYLTPDDQVAHPTPLVSGKDLMQALHLPAGPQVGQLLTEIALAQVEGKISTSAEALKLASQLIHRQGFIP